MHFIFAFALIVAASGFGFPESARADDDGARLSRPTAASSPARHPARPGSAFQVERKREPSGFRAESTGHTAQTETCKGGPVACRAFINACLAGNGGVWTDDGKPIPQEWHCTTP